MSNLYDDAIKAIEDAKTAVADALGQIWVPFDPATGQGGFHWHASAAGGAVEAVRALDDAQTQLIATNVDLTPPAPPPDPNAPVEPAAPVTDPNAPVVDPNAPPADPAPADPTPPVSEDPTEPAPGTVEETPPAEAPV